MFQSSPARKGGCYVIRLSRWVLFSVFQSSPARKGGCYPDELPQRCILAGSFNPHPPERAGATTCRRFAPPIRRTCFNPHPPERAGATRPAPSCQSRNGVSILTRPKGRVLRRTGMGRWWSHRRVSILTRPKGRVLRHRTGWEPRSLRSFNPHPPERAGATFREGYRNDSTDYDVSILTRPKGRVLRAYVATDRITHSEFQSSPARKGGCYCALGPDGTRRRPVSILTRPKGRVLPPKRIGGNHDHRVSILTRPKGRVLRPR